MCLQIQNVILLLKLYPISNIQNYNRKRLRWRLEKEVIAPIEDLL